MTDSQSRGNSLRIALMYKLDKLKTSAPASAVLTSSEDSKETRAVPPTSEAPKPSGEHKDQQSTMSDSTDGEKMAEGEKLADQYEHPSSEGFALNYIEHIEREGDALRTKLLHSLAMKKIWVPPSMKPKTHQTGTIYCNP